MLKLNWKNSTVEQIRLSEDHPDELLYGRAGFLWACLFLNKHFGKDTIPSTSMVGHVKCVCLPYSNSFLIWE